MSTHPTVEAVAFDLDDTLCDYGEAKVAALSRVAATVSTKSMIREGFLASYRLHEPRLLNAFLSNRVSMEEYRTQRFQMPLEANGMRATAEGVQRLNETYIRYCNQEAKLFPEAASVLNTLRRSGVGLAIITNGPSEGQRVKIKALDIGYYFEAVIISSEVGIAKPDTRIFQHAADALGVNVKNMLMVGDSLNEDYRGALNAGCQALLLNRKASGINSMTAVITSLTQVINKVERRNPATSWGNKAQYS